MRRSRASWPLLLILGVLVAVVAILLSAPGDDISAPEGGTPREVSGPRPELAATGRDAGTTAPTLAGLGARETNGPSGGKSSKAAAAPPAISPLSPRRRASRLVDAAGHPVHGAEVTLEVRQPDGPVQVNLRADDEGRVDLWWPEGSLVRIRVSIRSEPRRIDLMVRANESGIDVGALDEIVLEDYLYVPVLTVDARRTPRPGQRVLYRLLEAGEPTPGWWGATSDAEGRISIGPLARGTALELRNGPLGLAPEALADRGTWQRAVADGSGVEVVVPAGPRLRLEFPGVAPETLVPITLLDLRTLEPVSSPVSHRPRDGAWSAPDLAEDLDLGVVVGPLADGRFARLSHVTPTAEPIRVKLVFGVPVTGTARTDETRGPLRGTVAAHGDGLAVETPLFGDGRFAFPGLPDEPQVLVVRASPAGGEGRALAGVARRDGERYVDVRLARLLRVRGTVLERDDEGTRPSRRLAVLQTVPLDLPRALGSETPCGSRFEVDLLPGRWRLVVLTRDGQATAATDLEVARDLDDVSLLLQ